MFVPTLAAIAWMCAAGAVGYLVTAAVLLASRLAFERRHRVVQDLEKILAPTGAGLREDEAFRRRRAGERLARVRVPTLMRIAADITGPRVVHEALAEAVLARVESTRVTDLARAERPRRVWQRIAALRLLAFGRSPAAWECLERALESESLEVRAAAVTLLGRLGDRRAAVALVDALDRGRYARSRIAASLDALAIDAGDLIAPLLTSSDRLVRFWAATLIQRYPETAGVAGRVLTLTNDPEPIVRKAAIDAAVTMDGAAAEQAVRDRLFDNTDFVRAHAARSLGVMAGPQAISALAPLLADRSWVVRDAAREALRVMGPPIAPAVIPFLSHPDAFARNGAAEVLQNIGVFERLLTLEAEGPSDPERLRTVYQLAQAGGARMWDAVLDRLAAPAQARARQILASVDVQAAPGHFHPAPAQGVA